MSAVGGPRDDRSGAGMAEGWGSFCNFDQGTDPVLGRLGGGSKPRRGLGTVPNGGVSPG